MKSYDVGIIGGGLAGSSTAFELSKKGLSVIIFEKGHSIASGASGNHQGLVIPYITSEKNPAHQIYKDAFAVFREVTNELQGSSSLRSLRSFPALQFLSADRPKRLGEESLSDVNPRLQRISRNEASSICGVPLRDDVLLYPESFCVSPPELCNAFISCNGIARKLDDGILDITPRGSSWILHSKKETAAVEHVVIANGYEAKHLPLTAFLFLHQVRGELFTFETSHPLMKLKVPLCFDGYCLPAYEGRVLLGATYDHNILDPTPLQSHTDKIVENLNRWIEELLVLPKDSFSPRVSFRTSTFDRLPYVGQLPDFENIKNLKLRWSNREHFDLPTLPGLYVNLGHGSRGLLSTILAARILCDLIIKGRSEQVNQSASILDPMRYVYRLVKQEKLKAS